MELAFQHHRGLRLGGVVIGRAVEVQEAECLVHRIPEGDVDVVFPGWRTSLDGFGGGVAHGAPNGITGVVGDVRHCWASTFVVLGGLMKLQRENPA
ncbi:hypothetical protein D9M70_599410 [compost metagenome]